MCGESARRHMKWCLCPKSKGTGNKRRTSLHKCEHSEIKGDKRDKRGTKGNKRERYSKKASGNLNVCEMEREDKQRAAWIPIADVLHSLHRKVHALLDEERVVCVHRGVEVRDAPHLDGTQQVAVLAQQVVLLQQAHLRVHPLCGVCGRQTVSE